MGLSEEMHNGDMIISRMEAIRSTDVDFFSTYKTGFVQLD